MGAQCNVESNTQELTTSRGFWNMNFFLEECLPIVLFIVSLCGAIVGGLLHRDFRNFLSLTLKLAYMGRAVRPKSLINIEFQPLQLARGAQNICWSKHRGGVGHCSHWHGRKLHRVLMDFNPPTRPLDSKSVCASVGTKRGIPINQ